MAAVLLKRAVMAKRALIVEDDAAIRALVNTVVTREGFSADVEEDGRGAIQKMETGCYDLVLLDLMMPHVDGYAVIEFLKNRRPANLKRVIVMSAASEALKTKFPEPVCTFLPKPFDIDQLKESVRHCAGQCSEAAATP